MSKNITLEISQRYRIEANLLGKGCEDLDPQVFHTSDISDAEVLFRVLLDHGIRPLRLIDQDEGDRLIMKAENGIRTSC